MTGSLPWSGSDCEQGRVESASFDSSRPKETDLEAIEVRLDVRSDSHESSLHSLWKTSRRASVGSIHLASSWRY